MEGGSYEVSGAVSFRDGDHYVGEPITLPTTKVLAHVPGFTLLRNLYLLESSMYIVLEDGTPKPIEPLERILSRVGDVKPGVDMVLNGDEIRYINLTYAKTLFRNTALYVEGSTLLLHDTDQFTSHYFHWWAEVIAGAWRLWNSHLQVYPKDRNQNFPSRFLLPNVPTDRWHDPANLNGPLTVSVFPWAPVETSKKWETYRHLHIAVLLETAALLDRSSTNKHVFGNMWGKTLGSALDLPVAPDHWKPLRNRLLLTRFGTIPPRPKTPVVLYISRQKWGRRSLDVSSHNRLVEGLRMLESEGICTFVEAEMDKLSMEQQIWLAYNATVMLGVHGNGLTHQLWMPPTRKSLVLEIFWPENFAYDFYSTAQTIGHKHYGIWFDEEVDLNELSKTKWPNYGPQFHAVDIPVDGGFVTNLIRQHLLS
ncbi:hypothetical protein HDU93_006507 [Gonapodya sp. JEL0774]|nr:hypothetical protein HDU93_006507 [Gonapodya sp. JEL0774]